MSFKVEKAKNAKNVNKSTKIRNNEEIEDILIKELEVLDKLIYRSKNQHKSSIILRKMIQLKRLVTKSLAYSTFSTSNDLNNNNLGGLGGATDKFSKNLQDNNNFKNVNYRMNFSCLSLSNLKEIDKNKITECAKNLYIAGSSNLCVGYFIPLSLCIMGASARIFYLIDNCKTAATKNIIDDIFGD